MGLEETNLEIKIQDAAKPISDKFDLVIVDLYQGDNFPKKFETEKFLKSLSQNKLVIFNRLYYKEKKKMAEEFGEKLRLVFANVEYFYPITNLMMICSQ